MVSYPGRRLTAEEIAAIEQVEMITLEESAELAAGLPDRLYRLFVAGGHINEAGEWISTTWSKPEGWDDE